MSDNLMKEFHDLTNLLRSWNTPKDVIDKMEADNINVTSFKYFDDSDFEKYFITLNKQNVMPVFIKKFRSWQNMMKDDELSQNSDSTDEYNLFIKIMQSNTKLKFEIKSYYEKHSILSKHYRKEITNLIYNYFNLNGLTFKTSLLKAIVQQIEDEFPNEKKDIYYKRKHNIRSGLLYSKIKNSYYYVDKKSANKGVGSSSNVSSTKTTESAKNIPKSTHHLIQQANKSAKDLDSIAKKKGSVPKPYTIKSQSKLLTKQSMNKQNITKNTNDSDKINCPEECLKLLEDQDVVLPEENVLKLWNISCALRWSRFYHKTEAHEICEQFSYLKTSYGHKLIAIDYNYNFGESTGVLTNWKLYEAYAQKRLSKKNEIAQEFYEILSLYDETKSSNEEGKKVMHMLYAIYEIYKNDKSSKLNYKSRQESFLQITNSVIHMRTIMMENRKSAIAGKSTVQPKLFIVDNLNEVESFYVTFNDVISVFNDFTAAITACFHLFMVFDLKYPTECTGLWEFIQAFIFENKQSISNNIVNFINTIKKVSFD